MTVGLVRQSLQLLDLLQIVCIGEEEPVATEVADGGSWRVLVPGLKGRPVQIGSCHPSSLIRA